VTGARLVAAAKVTRTLRVVGVRPDGYHDLDAEMVTVDLADELEVRPGGSGLSVDDRTGGWGDPGTGPDNLVRRALDAVGARAEVRLIKHIPVGAGLGGGSADAAAVLRWAGARDPAVAASLGADVAFCVLGGRARVRGIGERVEPLPFEDRRFVLLVPPLAVSTAAVYRAWDALAADRRRSERAQNDLLAAALVVEPRLAAWREVLGSATGRTPELAGSGSTWFVEGTPEELGLTGTTGLALGPDRARVIATRTVPAGWGEGGTPGS